MYASVHAYIHVPPQHPPPQLCVLQEQLEKVEAERVRLQVAIHNLLETPQLDTENFGVSVTQRGFGSVKRRALCVDRLAKIPPHGVKFRTRMRKACVGLRKSDRKAQV